MKPVHLSEVLSYRDFCSIVGELVVLDRLFEVDVMDNVGPLIAPVADDAFSAELQFDHLLKLMITVGAILHFFDFLQARNRAHKLKAAIDSQSAA